MGCPEAVPPPYLPMRGHGEVDFLGKHPHRIV